MSVEREERLILRLSVQETAALLKLMSLRELPGLSVWAEDPREETVGSLVRSGIVTPCGEKTLVDRTIAWALRSAAKSRRYLAAASASGAAALYVAEGGCVLAENVNSAVVRIEPIRNLPSAKTAWANALRNLGKTLALTLAMEGGAQTLTGDAQTAKALLTRLEDSEVR